MQAPISSRLNAVDLTLLFVFSLDLVSQLLGQSSDFATHLFAAALIEYAVILLLLKKRRKPRRTIDEGLKTLFSNGDAGQARREEMKKPVSKYFI